MKKDKSLIVVIGIVILLAVGYYIPTIVMQIKDWSMMKEEIEVEMESILLDTQEVDQIEALDHYSEMISSQLIVEVGDGFAESRTEVMQHEEEALQRELFMHVQEFLTLLDVKEDVKLVEFSAQNYTMMAKSNEEKMYSIWMCKGEDKSGEEYLFWIDATLNKVMSFDIPLELFGKDNEAFYSGLERVLDYYNFESFGFPIHSYAVDMDELLKTKYWKNEIEILDKDLEIILSLGIHRNGERFLFNVEPGSVTYDVQMIE